MQNWKIGSITQEEKSYEALTARQSHHVKYTMPELRIRKIALSRISTSPWVTASCCSDGSLAVIQPLWVQPIAANHLDVNAFDDATAFPAGHKRMAGKYVLDVFGEPVFWTRPNMNFHQHLEAGRRPFS